MTYELPQLVKDQKVHALATRFDPGGNGINVGRALKQLQTAAHNYCVIAGEIGQLLKSLIADQVDGVMFTQVEGETRINGTFIELEPHAQYEVSGLGPAIPDFVLESLLDGFVHQAAKGFGVVTGSIQASLPAQLYADLAESIMVAGGKVIVDAHNDTLRLAVERRPFMIKPNRYELEQLLKMSLPDLPSVVKQARRLQRQGIEYVCVSLGEEGALLVGPDNSYHARAPSVEVASSVGAGDSMVAALVAAFAHGMKAQQALQLAVACSVGTVMQSGTGLFHADDIAVLRPQIDVEPLDA